MIDVYLAGPYSDVSRRIRQHRYEAHCKCTAWLMKQDLTVFSPIAHSHAVSIIGKIDCMDNEFWLRQDFAILPHCRMLAVMELPGWDSSKGTMAEILKASQLGIEIKRITCMDFNWK